MAEGVEGVHALPSGGVAAAPRSVEGSSRARRSGVAGWRSGALASRGSVAARRRSGVVAERRSGALASRIRVTARTRTGVVGSLALLAPLWCVPFAGCSFVTADVGVAPCTDAEAPDFATGNARCEGLGPPEPCAAWVCRDLQGGDYYCMRGAPDEDDDGAGDAACGGTDCDDADPARAGGFDERCDGVDNDCDETIDEDVLSVGGVERVIVGVGEGTQLSVPPGSNVVAAAWRAEDDRLALGFRGSEPAPVSVEGAEVFAYRPALSSEEPGLAIASRSESRAVVAVVPRGCRRLALVSDVASCETYFGGLPDGSGAFCDRSACGGEASSRSASVRAPALALDGDDYLVAWIEDDAEPTCGTGGGGDVLLVAGTLGTTPEAAVSLDLGEAVDLALVSLGGGRYAVAVAGASLQVHLVATAGGVALEDTVDLEVARAGDLSLVRGGDALGLAYVEGCGGRAQAGLQRLGEDLSVGARTMAPGEGHAAPHAAVSSTSPAGWLLTWVEGNAVRAQLFGLEDGAAGEALTLYEAESVRAPLARRGLESGFEVLVASEGAGADEAGIFAASLACE